MRKAQQVIGLPVYCVSTGRKLGVVRDLLFDEERVLRGVVLEPKGLLRRGLYIPSELILSIGEDSLTVRDEKAISPLDGFTPYTTILSGEQKLKGKTVITTNGHELGHIHDVYFHEEVGTIIGYELTDGFFSDVLEGRKFLPQPEHLTIGQDAMVVPQEMEEQLHDKIEE